MAILAKTPKVGALLRESQMRLDRIQRKLSELRVEDLPLLATAFVSFENHRSAQAFCASQRRKTLSEREETFFGEKSRSAECF